MEKVKRGKERGGEEMRAEEKWTKREGCEGYRELQYEKMQYWMIEKTLTV